MAKKNAREQKLADLDQREREVRLAQLEAHGAKP